VPDLVRVGEINQHGGEYTLKSVPAFIPITGYGHLIIISQGGAKIKALELLQSVVTRLALTFPVLAAQFVFIDPLGLGDNFPFKRLPESVRGNAVYSESDEIRSRMRELTEHLRQVTQKYLAREYDNIEAYNQAAEEIVEPYRFLAIADFPAKFDNDACERLISVAERGVRTGVYLLMHIDADQPLPRGFNLDALKRMASVIVAHDDKFVFTLNGIDYEFQSDSVPSSDVFNTLMDKIGAQALKGAFRGVPFEKIAPAQAQWWTGDSREVVDVSIGRAGARDQLRFWLGKQNDGRISSHALIGGKTGSGKSTLMHVFINSLALTYSPNELELYLIDFKEGVEFKPYADAQLPHARVVAIESEREFGLSVLRELQTELERRGSLFKEANAQDITAYRNRTNAALPRMLCIIDEFQILFREQDTIANRAASIVDDLARRGRAFGIHIVMGSQSVRVANLSTSTYGQFATRIVLQSPEEEVVSLLGADNVDAAKVLDRPGEIIYNDAGGQRDRNQPGQVAILRDEAIPALLRNLREFAQLQGFQRQKPLIVFRGNQASILEDNAQMLQLYDQPDWLNPRDVKDLFDLRDWVAAEHPALVWLGEAIEIKPHTAAAFKRRSRANLLIVGDREDIIFGMIGSALLSLTAFHRPGDAVFRIVDLSLKEEAWENTAENFEQHFDMFDIGVRERRGSNEFIDEVADQVQKRHEAYKAGQDNLGAPLYFIVAGAQRMADLRPVSTRFGNEPSEYAKKLMDILQRGPEVGVHVIMWVDNVKNFDMIFDRRTLAYFDRRVALAMNKEDSQFLLGEPAAAMLGQFRALLQDEEANGVLEKFKPYALPVDKVAREQKIKYFADLLRRRTDI